jgi:hypothetical protein
VVIFRPPPDRDGTPRPPQVHLDDDDRSPAQPRRRTPRRRLPAEQATAAGDGWRPHDFRAAEHDADDDPDMPATWPPDRPTRREEEP